MDDILEYIKPENYTWTVKNIRESLYQYIKKHELKSLVIGVSGGIDSALCCVLAKPICDLLKIPLIGMSIPIISNKEEEILRAEMVGKIFCTKFAEKYLSKIYAILASRIMNEKEDPHSKEYDIRSGNIKARLRMIQLYDIARKNNGIVLSTDNYTELLLGFWTLHGDVGDYGMIQSLWKTEVYALTKFIKEDQFEDETKSSPMANALQLCIDAVPTDGLGVSESDLDQIGAKDYGEVDMILKGYVHKEVDCWKNGKSHPVIQRHEATNYKRNNPLNIQRETIKRIPQLA